METIYRDCIQELIDNYRFGEFLDCELSFYQWTKEVNDKLYDFGYFLATGACRCIITREDWSFVLKFTYDTDDCVNYCENERYLYEKAKERGIEKAFAACEYVGKFGAYDIYVMDKCSCNEDSMENASWEYQFKRFCEEEGLDPQSNEAYDEFSDVCCECYEQECMLELASSHWGKAMYHAVKDFIADFGINDCHCGNWGWHKDDLVIVDYAGYGTGARMIRDRRIAEERI